MRTFMSLTTNDFREIYPQLKAYAMSRCKNSAIADDLVSETIITAIEKLSEGLSINDLTAWCVTVLRNKHLDFVKKKREQQLDAETPEDQTLEDSRGTGDGFTNLLFSECMEKLKQEHAEVMVMNIVKGMTTKVISEIVGKPQNTILTWLTKAKTEFHDCIEGRT